jgi:hypothetical protein
MTELTATNVSTFEIIWGTFFVALFFVANIFWWRATTMLVPGTNRLRIYFWTGLFARRKNFTAEGWRYRNWTVITLLMLLVLAIMNPAL